MTTSVIQDGQAFTSAYGDATVLKRFFCENFAIFRCTSKRIAVLELVIFSTCAYMPIFDFRDGHVTTFRQPSGAYICQMPSHRLSKLAKGNLQSLGFPSVSLIWGKTVSCRMCAGQSKGTLKREKCCFWIWLRPRYKISEFFHDSTCSHLHFGDLPPKSRLSVVSI